MHYQRLKRQFNFLIKSIRKYKAQNVWESLPLQIKGQLFKKLTSLSKRLAGSFTPAYARKLSFALGVLFIGVNATAQSFQPPVLDPFSLPANSGLGDPELIDIDADGDLDMFKLDENTTFYYENVGSITSPQFASPQSLPFGIEQRPVSWGHTGLVMGDIDNDGDYDLLMGGYYEGDIYYQENIGTDSVPNFAPKTTNPFGIAPPFTSLYTGTHPDLVDIDDDGDLDLLTSETYGDVRFYENVGTPEIPSFSYVSSPVFLDSVIQQGFSNDLVVSVVDIDNDCDYDLMFGHRKVINPGYDEELWFFENIGTKCNPQFASGILDPFNYSPPTDYTTFWTSAPDFGDLDNDGDQDLITGLDQNLRYYENDGSGIPVVTQGCDATLQVSACDSLNFNGTTYTSSGQYDYTMISSIGCDSTTTINLVINPTTSSSESVTICDGEDYTYPDGAVDSNITSATSHVSILSSSITGCDSLVTTTLAVNPSQQSSESASICEGEDYTYPDGFTEANINTGTSHISTLSSAVTGCDSLVTTSISLNTVDIGTTLSGDTIYASAVGANYQWIDCGANSIVPGETGASFAAGETGDYAVEVTENSCVDTSACENITITPTGTQEYNTSSIKIWPNPTSRKVFIHLAHTAENGLPIEIRNPLGQVVVSEHLPPGTQFHELDLNQPKGIYFLSILESVYKVIIE